MPFQEPRRLTDCTDLARKAIRAGEPVFLTTQSGEGTDHVGPAFLTARGIATDEGQDHLLPQALADLTGFDDLIETPIGPMLMGYLVYLEGAVWQGPCLESYYGSETTGDLDPRVEQDGPETLRCVGMHLTRLLAPLTVRTFLLKHDRMGDRHELQVCVPMAEIAAAHPDYESWKARLGQALTDALRLTPGAALPVPAAG